MICPSCAAEVPPGARFCPSCGHALQAAADERRVATVVFADIVGFTALAETRDPEEVKHLVDRCFERLAADITSFGGHVDKIVGDALLALFGAPLAHEDDAERAVRAALRMQSSLGDLAGELGTELRMRIGVNTGEVLVGSLRAGGDYTAMGDVVNTASRLQTLAEPGQVIVGAETKAETEGVFRYEPLGELHTRGRLAAVQAWEAAEVLQEPGNRPRRLGIPLIGRDTELNLLTSAVHTAVAHRRPLLLLLTGEAGVGKSRLATQVLRQSAEELGVRQLLGRNLPYGPTNVWWSVAEMVRAACDIADDDAVTARAKCADSVAQALRSAPEAPETSRVVEGLLYLLGIEGRLTDVEPSRARDEAVAAARSFFHGLAARQPLLLVLGDAQWADDHVLDLVERVLDGVGRIPLVVMVTARPELSARWRPKVDGVNLVEVTLDPLGDEAAGELLVAMLGRDPGPTTRREMLDRAGGNALFLEEMASLLREGGELPPLSFGSLPANLRGLVAARLDALPPDERAAIDDLAVLGHSGSIAALSALAANRVASSGLLRALNELARKDLVELGEERCGFVSDLIREVAYNTLARAERAKRHVVLASWIEEEAARRDRVDESLEVVAHHWAAAAVLAAALGELVGVPDNVREIALVALQRAADQADDREMHRASKELYGQMLSLLGEEVGGARRHALVGRARATTAMRQNAEAALDLDVVEREATELGDDVALARALVVRGDLLRNQGQLERSVTTLERAVELWREIGDRRGEASALRRLGWTYVHAGDYDRAEPPILEALTAFREVGVTRGVAWALQNLALIAFHRGQSALAEDRLQDSLKLFAETGDPPGELWAAGLLAVVWHSQGNTAKAEELVERMMAAGSIDGDAWSSATLQLPLGVIRLRQGRVASAVDLLRRAHDGLRASNDQFTWARGVGPFAQALRRAGRFADAAEVVEAAVAVARGLPPTSGDRLLPEQLLLQQGVDLGDVGSLPDLVSSAHASPATRLDGGLDETRALALAQLGRADEAVELLAPTESDQPAALAHRALALAAAGRVDEASAVVDVVRGLGGAVYHDHVVVDLAEAMTKAMVGDLPGARSALDHAERVLEGTDDRLTAAIVGLARASLLGDEDGEHRCELLGLRAEGWRRLFRGPDRAGMQSARPASRVT